MKQAEIEKLLSEMTLSEKIGQLIRVSGDYYLEDAVITGPMKEQGFDEKTIGLAGSAIGSIGADKIKETQKAYMEKHPHKIPLLFMMDVINGFKTIFPIPLAQGASFDPELSKVCAEVAAKEASVAGVHVTFAPMLDLVRDARWGRVMESPGEDTYLNGKFAEALVSGFQGEDISEKDKLASCVKHFAGYGAPDAGRDYNTVELSDHTFREFYLPAYKEGIDAGAALVMSSFNTIEGVPATGNSKLMQGILREEMGFDGVVITDWAAIEEMIYHGYAKDRREAAKLAIQAGMDIDMMSGIYASELEKLVQDGEIDEKLIDQSALRVLELKNKLGLFENPYKDADADREKKEILCEEHRALARKAAKESFVLLKNEEQILPLKKESKVAFIGPYVNSQYIYGSWSFIGDTKDAVTLQQGVEQMDIEHASFAKGSTMLEGKTIAGGFTDVSMDDFYAGDNHALLEEAKKLAAEAEQVVLAIGECNFQSGEATSHAEIKIPQIQQRLLDAVYEVNPNIVVVLFNGRPLDLREVECKAKAVLEVWLPGTEGGAAIAETLYGAYNPSGKLSMSFPWSVGQLPMHYNEYSTGRPHVPGKDKDRFRSKYLDAPNTPLYPFGYGLSYTTFEIGKPQVSSDILRKDAPISVEVKVKNNGNYAGKEVVQLYIRDLFASVVRPVKELKGYEKIELAPGEEKTVTFEIDEQMLRFYRRDGIFGSEAGEFHIYVGNSSATTEYVSIQYEED